MVTAANSNFPMQYEIWFVSLHTKIGYLICANKESFDPRQHTNCVTKEFESGLKETTVHMNSPLLVTFQSHSASPRCYRARTCSVSCSASFLRHLLRLDIDF